jgi:hypothetical protein
MPVCETTAIRRVVPFEAGLSVGADIVRRPSSHTNPTPFAIGNVETKPCSVGVSSVCGVTGAVQVAPPSALCATRMSYAKSAPARRTSQCAIHRELPASS